MADLLSAKEIAEVLKMDQSHVAREPNMAEPEYYSQFDSPLGRETHLAVVRRGKLQGYKVGKRVLVKREAMLEYIEANPAKIVWHSADDIIAHEFGESALGPPVKTKVPWFLPLAHPKEPGVYAIQGAGNYVKIGKASNIAERIRDIQTNHPVPLKLLSVLSTDPNDEKKFHRQLRKHRAQGEWFHLHAEVIKVLVSGRRGQLG